MRKIFYGIILLLMLCVPLERLDVAKLLPIEAVALYMDNGQIVLETDTQDVGKGTSVEQALQNLKDITPAVVYLDTARYLLIAEDAVGYTDAISRYLKASVEVAVCDAKGVVKDTVKYLDAHGGTTTLRDMKNK